VICAVQAKAIASEIDAVGVVDEAVKNGVCVSRIADNVVPPVDWELAGDDCRFSPVAFFEDFEEIMPCGGIERFETPVVKDEELHAPKRPQESGIAAIAARQCEISEELGNALIENGSVIAAGAVAGRASEPAFADAGWAAQDDVIVGIDPTALGELLEQGAIETARGTIVAGDAERFDQPHDSETCPKALFGMRAMLQDQVAQRRRRRTDRSRVCADTIKRPVGVTPMAGGHVLLHGRVFAVAAQAQMCGDPFASGEYLNATSGEPNLDLGARARPRSPDRSIICCAAGIGLSDSSTTGGSA
jgi:hypothetical protein